MEVFDSETVDERHVIQPINLASIGKVCETDAETINIVMKEIVAQLRHQLRNGASIRLMFKIGKLIGKSGALHWRSFKDDDRLIMASSDINSIAAGSTFSKAMINSTYKKDLSVVTPSITSRTASQTPKSMKFHIMNTNS